MSARTYGEKWHGFTAAPRPPRDIELEMQEAGAAGDQVRLGLARARYEQWLADQGHQTAHRGSGRPDEDDQ